MSSNKPSRILLYAILAMIVFTSLVIGLPVAFNDKYSLSNIITILCSVLSFSGAILLGTVSYRQSIRSFENTRTKDNNIKNISFIGIEILYTNAHKNARLIKRGLFEDNVSDGKIICITLKTKIDSNYRPILYHAKKLNIFDKNVHPIVNFTAHSTPIFQLPVFDSDNNCFFKIILLAKTDTYEKMRSDENTMMLHNRRGLLTPFELRESSKLVIGFDLLLNSDNIITQVSALLAASLNEAGEYDVTNCFVQQGTSYQNDAFSI